MMGNGRTARLLMNLMLIRSGYVPVPVGPEDRQEYRDNLKTAQLEHNDAVPAFQAFMHLRLEAMLQQYVSDLLQGREWTAPRSRSKEAADAREPSSDGRRPTSAQPAFLASRDMGR